MREEKREKTEQVKRVKVILRTHQSVMLQTSISHVTRTNKSYHTYQWVMSHISRVTMRYKKIKGSKRERKYLRDKKKFQGMCHTYD